MLTDKEIRDHKISLTSTDILNKYQEEIKPKRSFNFKKFFGILVPTAFVAVLSTTILVNYFNNENKNNITSIINNEEGNRITIGVISSLYLFNDNSNKTNTINKTSFNSLNTFSEAITESEFATIVDSYDKLNSLVELQLNKNQEAFSKVENFDYKGIYDTYKYLITINGNEEIKYYLNYTKDEKKVIFNGELSYKNKVYRIEGKNKVENDETEYEYTSYLDENNYVKVSENKEVDEYSYEYTPATNGNKDYSFSYSKEENVELSYEDATNEFEFSVNSSSSVWLIEYSNNDLEGTMSLTHDGNSKIYEDLETKIKIIK